MIIIIHLVALLTTKKKLIAAEMLKAVGLSILCTPIRRHHVYHVDILILF